MQRIATARSLHTTATRFARQPATSAPSSGGSAATGPVGLAGSRFLAPTRLRRVRTEESLSYFTEMLRYRKAMVCMYADKIREEFPRLKDYAVPFSPRRNDQILRFYRDGLVYPGTCDKPDPMLARRCTVEVRLDDLLPFLHGQKNFRESGKTKGTARPHEEKDFLRKKAALLAGDAYNPNTDVLLLESDQFPEYGMNKKYVVDCLVRMVEAVRDTSNDKVFRELETPPLYGTERAENFTPEGQERQHFPEEWKRLDLANKPAFRADAVSEVEDGEQEEKLVAKAGN